MPKDYEEMSTTQLQTALSKLSEKRNAIRDEMREVREILDEKLVEKAVAPQGGQIVTPVPINLEGQQN